MKTIAFSLTAIVATACLAQSALAQPVYAPPSGRASPPPLALAGAGGSGGAGGGATGVTVVPASRCGVAFVNPVPEYTSHVRSSAPPPMDPCRKVEIVECTRPFDPFRGNIVCR